MTERVEADREWVLRAQGGDRHAFAVLVRKYQDRIYRLALQMLGSPDEGLDVAQETFFKAWRALPEWRPEAQFHTWLFHIAANTARDALRRRKVVQFVPLEEDYEAASDAPGPEAALQMRETLGAVDRALARLPHDQREIVLLREVEGLSYEELAAVLGIDQGTVKSRLARARVALAARERRERA